jgi:hypothetical protein
MATIEKRYLAPLNSPAITEADRPKVYGIIGKELAKVLSGAKSYYSDGVQKDPWTLASDLNNFISSIRALQERVDDPSNVLGTVADALVKHAEGFKDFLNKNEPVDNIEMPSELSPTSRDRNDLYVDPDPGPYSPPNPVSPNQRPKYFNASLAPSDDAASGETVPGLYPRLRGRGVSSIFAGNNSSNQPAPPLQTDPPLGIYSGKPMRQWIIPPPIWGRR